MNTSDDDLRQRLNIIHKLHEAFWKYGDPHDEGNAFDYLEVIDELSINDGLEIGSYLAVEQFTERSVNELIDLVIEARKVRMGPAYENQRGGLEQLDRSKLDSYRTNYNR